VTPEAVRAAVEEFASRVEDDIACEGCGDPGGGADCPCLICEECGVSFPGGDEVAVAAGWRVVRDSDGVLVVGGVLCAECSLRKRGYPGEGSW
jgi:hypothetical protein